jgi:hypothetical protein
MSSNMKSSDYIEINRIHFALGERVNYKYYIGRSGPMFKRAERDEAYVSENNINDREQYI